MTNMVRHPNGGWYRPGPTHCRLGHKLTPGRFITGWDFGRPYWYCEHPDHPDHASRWLFLTGDQAPAEVPMNTADHGTTG